jgi:hypothetical protein
MILLGKDFLSLVQGCKIKPAVIQYTDHQSVVLTFWIFFSNLCLSSLVNFDLFLQYIVVTSRISTFIASHNNLMSILLFDQKAKGAQIRCREKWVEYGEKNNSYFLGLEKQRQIKKSINKLIDENNEKITFKREIGL